MIHDGAAQIVGVRDIREACEAAGELYKNGVGCIELYGVFEEDGAKEIIKATGDKIPVGYITHLPGQDEIYKMAFLGK